MGEVMRHQHHRFYPAREIERVTWKDYATAVGFALALLALVAVHF